MAKKISGSLITTMISMQANKKLQLIKYVIIFINILSYGLFQSPIKVILYVNFKKWWMVWVELLHLFQLFYIKINWRIKSIFSFAQFLLGVKKWLAPWGCKTSEIQTLDCLYSLIYLIKLDFCSFMSIFLMHKFDQVFHRPRQARVSLIISLQYYENSGIILIFNWVFTAYLLNPRAFIRPIERW